MKGIFAVTAALLVAVAPAVSAQHREFALEATPIHGTLTYAWGGSGDRVTGLSLGFGFPQIDRTLEPGDEALNDFLHVGVFTRSRFGPVEADGRVQLGLAELRGCSGCLPGVLGGLSGGLFVGGRRFAVGARILAGVIAEQANSPAGVVNLMPFAVRVTFGR